VAKRRENTYFVPSGVNPMRAHPPSTAVLLTLVLWLLVGDSTLAARLLHATVELDGEVVLSSSYTSPDSAAAATVWRYLSQESYHTEISPKVELDSADPLRANLHGSIVICIRHVERVIVEAKATELTLIRAQPTSDQWFLPQGEIERLAQSNGIPDPPVVDPSMFELLWWLVPLAVVGLLIATVLVMALWLLSRSKRIRARDRTN
jgi:hypothetical protein